MRKYGNSVLRIRVQFAKYQLWIYLWLYINPCDFQGNLSTQKYIWNLQFKWFHRVLHTSVHSEWNMVFYKATILTTILLFVFQAKRLLKPRVYLLYYSALS